MFRKGALVIALAYIIKLTLGKVLYTTKNGSSILMRPNHICMGFKTTISEGLR